MLHAVVSRQLASNPTLLAGWNGARRVTSKPGVARGGIVSTPAAGIALATPPDRVPLQRNGETNRPPRWLHVMAIL